MMKESDCKLCPFKEDFEHVFTWMTYTEIGMEICLCMKAYHKSGKQTLHLVHFSIDGRNCYDIGKIEGEFDVDCLIGCLDKIVEFNNVQCSTFFQSGVVDCTEFFIQVLMKYDYALYEVVRKYTPRQRVEYQEIGIKDLKYMPFEIKKMVFEVQRSWDSMSRKMTREEANEYLEMVERNKDEEIDAMRLSFNGPEHEKFDKEIFGYVFASINELTKGATYFNEFFRHLDSQK